MAEGDDDTASVLIGVILVILGAVGQNLGNNIVSIAHANEHEDAHHHHVSTDDGTIKYSTIEKMEPISSDVEMASITDVKSEPGSPTSVNAISKDTTPLKKPWSPADHLWGIGTTVFVTSSVMCFIAYGFAAQSLLASLESVQFVSNIIFAKVVLKEDITLSMLLSTVLIIGGNALVVIFSGSTALLLNGEEIFDYYATNTPFHVYLIVAGLLVVGCEYTWKHYNYSRMKLRTKLWNHSFIEPLCFCTSSAIIGAFAVVNAKNMSMMLNSSASTDRSEFENYQLYIVFFVWIFVVLFWVFRIDLGLDLFPPLFVIPVIQVCFMLYAIICGGLFFKEFEAFDTKQHVGFSSGVVLILIGVYGLAPDSELDFSGENKDDDDDDANNKYESGREIDDQQNIPSLKSRSSLKKSRRLSFSVQSTAVPEAVVAAEPEPTEKRPSMRGRRRASTMVHPLAALREITRISAQAGEENATVAPVVRAARRLSAIALPPSFLEEYAEESFKGRGRTESSATDLTSDQHIISEENEEDV